MIYMYQTSIRVRSNEFPLYEGCPSIGVSVSIPVLVPCSSQSSTLYVEWLLHVVTHIIGST